jgi:hypothetical protein
MTTLHDITINEAALAACCRKYGVDRLWLFGSILRDDFRNDSDIDALVAFRHDGIGAFELGGLAADLSDLWHREVHLTTFNSVPETYRPWLLKSAKLEYSDG